MDLFFELLQISLGNKETFEHLPSDMEWQALLDLANKQSLASVLFMGLEKVLEQPGISKPSALFEWIGVHQTTATLNKRQNKRAKELTEIFSKQGFRSCVLKGHGSALYYEKREFLLSEIMTAGNFGHYDERIKQIDHDKRFKHGFSQLKRNLHFVTYYPSEVL